MTASLVVSVHDVAPATFWATRWWANELDRRGVRATYLAVPGPWDGPTFRADRELAAWLRGRVECGDEVAQHGWTHRAGPEGAVWRRMVGAVAARGCAEFWALDEEEARRRLERGRAVLRAAGIDPQGFTPPGWLASLATVRALRELGYRYTTSHLGVTDLGTGARWRVPALSQRPTAAAAEPLAAAAVALVARRFAREGRSVRIALHPGDLTRPRLVAGTLRAIDRLVAAGARPRTYLEFLIAQTDPPAAAPGRAA